MKTPAQCRRTVAKVRRELAAGRDRDEVFAELRRKEGAHAAHEVIRQAGVKP